MIIPTKFSKSWVLLAVVLYSPMATSLLRKILPGQPNFIEPASAIVVLWGAAMVVQDFRKVPTHIAIPFLLWGLMQFFYSGLSVFYAWQVGPIALVTRVVPMLSCLIGFSVCKQPSDLSKLAGFALAVSLVLLPFGAAVAMFGNSILPDFLRPLRKLSELGLDVSKDQFHAFAGIFSTQTHLAYAMFLATTLGLLAILSSPGVIKKRIFWWSGVFASIMLSYLATRRAVFLSTVAVSCRGFMLFGKKSFIIVPICGMALVAGIYLFDVKSEIVSTRIKSRSEVLFSVDLKDRLQGLFLGETIRWTNEWPLGTCLGCAGPEAQAFNVQIEYVEIGSQLILGEMGIMGLALFLFTVSVPTLVMLRKAKHDTTKKLIKVIAVYQLLFVLLFLIKAAKIVTQVSSAQIFFWASYGIGAALCVNEDDKPPMDV